MSNLDAALALQQQGLHPLVLAPLTKVSAVKGFYDHVNTPAALRTVWDETVNLAKWVEQQRATDFARFRNDTGDLTWTPALAASRVDNYTVHEPNVGLYLGGSGLVLIDVDDPQEFDGWTEVCSARGFDPGPPTVRSPGVCTPEGVWKHRSGGHWIYRVPDDLRTVIAGERTLTAPRLTPAGFVTVNDALGLAQRYPQFMTNRRLGVVPPSSRLEGPYRGTLDDIQPLPEFLVRMIRAHLDGARVEKAKREARASTYQGTPTDSRYLAWERTLDVADVLDGWMVSGNDGECEVLEHPCASSPRSAVVHVPGCAHLGLGDDSDRRLVTIWSPNVDAWVQEALDDAGGNTVSLGKLIAYRDYDGDLSRMKRDLGLWSRGSSFTPPQTPRTATVVRVGSGSLTPSRTAPETVPHTPARGPVAPAPQRTASVIRVPSTTPAPTASDVLARVAGELSPEDTARVLAQVAEIMQSRMSG
ncbi:gp54 protein [Mycobacteroides abscessus subsp. abscessus]|uniref:bifunctional DNA primase/polymerase n=1 Tax=Mycobacteroides abscessus TaxID=36809 RepID=UPI0009A8754F|nr:bifunctional DNA primase/polymerase [Mycobacteroides abscessus]SKV12362.1 gp54 protein [Mycobacteroides abscessus subsp. abscessus]